jgi:hypothetical protein
MKQLGARKKKIDFPRAGSIECQFTHQSKPGGNNYMKRRYRFAAALMILAASAVAAVAQDKNEKLFYILNYSISHCDAEIELNGVTMTRSEKKTQYTVTGFSDVGMWISPGANTVTVTIRPIAKQKDLISKPSIELSVSTAKEGQMSNEGIKIMESRIPEKEIDNDLDSIKSPVIKKFSFTPSYIPPSELWGKIKPVKLDAASRKIIKKLVRDYHTAFMKKDVDALYSFLLFASTDVARLRHQPADEVKTKMKTALKEMISEKDFIMAPLDTEKLVMKPVADGRIIQITDRNGEAPVRTKTTKDSGSYSFPVFAGLVDGKWIMVR